MRRTAPRGRQLGAQFEPPRAQRRQQLRVVADARAPTGAHSSMFFTFFVRMAPTESMAKPHCTRPEAAAAVSGGRHAGQRTRIRRGSHLHEEHQPAADCDIRLRRRSCLSAARGRGAEAPARARRRRRLAEGSPSAPRHGAGRAVPSPRARTVLMSVTSVGGKSMGVLMARAAAASALRSGGGGVMPAVHAPRRERGPPAVGPIGPPARSYLVPRPRRRRARRCVTWHTPAALAPGPA